MFRIRLRDGQRFCRSKERVPGKGTVCRKLDEEIRRFYRRTSSRGEDTRNRKVSDVKDVLKPHGFLGLEALSFGGSKRVEETLEARSVKGRPFI